MRRLPRPLLPKLPVRAMFSPFRYREPANPILAHRRDISGPPPIPGSRAMPPPVPTECKLAIHQLTCYQAPGGARADVFTFL